MKIKIKVYRKGDNYIPKDEDLIETIERSPFHRGFCGNFVPHFCRYNGKIYLIEGSIDRAYMHGYEDDARIKV